MAELKAKYAGKLDLGPGMKKKLIKHIDKDDREFRGQIKDDSKLKKTIKKAAKKH